MKKLNLYLLILTIVFSSVVRTMAQSKEDYRSEKYERVISEIVEHSKEKLATDDVIDYLSGNRKSGSPNKSGAMITTLSLSPVIDIVAYDGTESAQFDIITEGQITSATFSITIPPAATWVNAPVINYSTKKVTIAVDANNEFTARQTPIDAVLILGPVTNTLSFTAYIIQEPAPQPVLLVSPEFMPIPQEGGITDPFSVIYFNINDWVATIPAGITWVSIKNQTHTGSPDLITFELQPNTTAMSRQVDIQLSATNNPAVNSTVTILQQAGQGPYLYVSPTENFIDPDAGTIEVMVFSNTTWNTEIINNPGTMISITSLPGISPLIVNVTQNSTPTAREAKIKVSGGSPVISDTITIYQSAAYILLNPKEKVLPDPGGTFEFEVTKYFVNSFNVVDNQPWVSISAGTNSDSFTVVVDANNSSTVRTAEVTVTSTDNPAIKDVLSIFQYPANLPYIILSPREQYANWNQTALAALFSVTANNVSVLTLEDDSDWLTPVFNNDSTAIEVAFSENPTTLLRTATIKVSSSNNPAVYDSVMVIQGGAPTYIHITPEFMSVSFEGGLTAPFVVEALNVSAWEVFFENGQPEWINAYEVNGTNLIFDVAPSTSTFTRQTTFKVRDTGNSNLYTEAIIFQEAYPESYLFISPREQAVAHTGNENLNFQVTPVNVAKWGVDPTSVPFWVEVNASGQELLSFKILENSSLQTRIANIFIRDTANASLMDSVWIYQYSALDTFLLAAPREQWVGHDGNNSLSFGVTSVNVENWQVETGSLPEWIGLVTSTLSQFTLDVQKNETLDTRQAMIRLVVSGHPDIYDSVFVYQYSALDTFLLAAPREQMIGHLGNDNVVFEVTSANVEAWQVEAASLPSWIGLVSSTFSQFILQVQQNNSLITRQATIKLFVNDHPDIFDLVSVYQYSALDTFLLAAPREQLIGHLGNDNSVFEVTSANVEAWQIETASLPEWIGLATSTFSQFIIQVQQNNSLVTRQATIKLFVNDHPDIFDLVSVYQYSALDTFLLAAPREQMIGHLGNDNVVFEVTSANVAGWQVEMASVPSWIGLVTSTFSQFTLDVQPNNTLETRQTTIKLSVNDHPDIFDLVSVYQYSALDTFLLAAPREQWVAHTETESLDFIITRVNVAAWEVDPASVPVWIEVNESGQDWLKLKILENGSLQTREANIFFSDGTNTSVMDSVWIYQYSALDTFLLAAPREQSVQFTGAEIEFHITSVNVGNWVIDPVQLPEWIEQGSNTPDKLRLTVLLNESLQARQETVYIFSQANAAVYDSVTIYQFAAEDPYILAAPREKKVSHLGHPAVDFNLTLVNVEEWEFADTTIYQDWIDFQNLGNKIRLSIAANEDLSARAANIVIQESGNPTVKDSVSVYQYSALDQYILMEPREQLAQRYSGDTLYFKATRVNVDQLGFDVFDDVEGMIDLANTTIENDTLTVFVNLNNDPNSRLAKIKVFDVDRPDEVTDTVSIYQNFPYIILRPSALDSLDWTGTVQTINSYSNVSQYTVRKGETFDWFQISKDSLNWSAQSLTLAGNDQFYLRVDSNNNSFLRRSSKLQFDISSSVATEFWFDQNTRPGKFFPVSGQVFIQNDPLQPLAGVSVALYDSIVKTNASGTYAYQFVPENWIGTITPLIDTALAIPYYFLPPRIEITGLGITDTTEILPFAAYKIDPAVTLTPKSTAICFGQMLNPDDPGYPSANITDTYGSSTYLWTADPPDSILSLNPTVLTPVFGPKVTTTYRLEVTNFFRTVSDNFTIIVNQLPEAFGFDGELTVCSDQAGVIYQVPNPQPSVYFKWELDDENPGGVFANSSLPYDVSGNIAIVNWGDTPGNYILRLYAFNQFDCAADPFIKTIEVTNIEAPPPSTVLRKENDNMLYSSDTLAKSYQWGWLQKNAAGELVQEYIIPDKNDWYCRLPDGHVFNPLVYSYFVIAYFDETSCGSRSFFNVPVNIDEITDKSITVYPNPGNGLFTVRFAPGVNTQGGVIEIYGISGQMIYSRNFKAASHEENVDLSLTGTITSGVYLLKVRTPVSLFNYKLIVQ
ncbi:MAG: T9SS type A sorting domain-containing protein [Bacteroidales bacterium]|nr:T9SS type A sorting domain-containing protein [Bacteroidales bacterium]